MFGGWGEGQVEGVGGGDREETGISMQNKKKYCFLKKKIKSSLVMWRRHMPLIPALGWQRQVDFCEFEASLIYRTSSRTGSRASSTTDSKATQ